MSTARTFRRLFVANRGEVAARIGRTCERIGIEPVFGVSESDRDAPYTRAHQTVVLGPSRASESYLDRERVVQAAVQTRCSALHPGWGFLAEDPAFATLCEVHGVTFVGPPAHVMARLAKKTPAKRAMADAGLKLVPGSDGLVGEVAEAEQVANSVGYPVLLKADSGGGGRGMRIARSKAEVAGAFLEAQGEARAAFGSGALYVEKLIEGGRHIEIQLLGDRYGNVVHLGERDCSIQRNHQKLIEESPAPTLKAAEREATANAAVRAARSLGYVGAGTMEFLLDEGGELRFLEMNTRLQVEHPVTEVRAGIDLVEAQLRVAAGERLWFSQRDLVLEGHSIECRINAEDPERDFAPSPGIIEQWEVGDGDGIRVDTHVEKGYEIPPFYDSLLCKVIAHGKTRKEAAARLVAALEKTRCDGVSTTIPMHLAVLQSKAFEKGKYDVTMIPGWGP